MTSGGGPARVLRPDAAGIGSAAALIRDGRLVAFGTETVYGLGALATRDDAVAAVFRAKGRPPSNPLICHVSDAASAWRLGVATPDARRLAERFWPGPLTLVLRRDGASPVVAAASAGGSTVALRVPGSAAARLLLEAVGAPVVAPSANRSGRISPTDAAAVIDELGDRIAAVLDTGPCPVGLESTVVDCSEEAGAPALLRPGFLSAHLLADALGRELASAGFAGALRSPGLLASHYAPDRPLRLDATAAAADEALLAFGPDVPDGAAVTVNLSARGDLAEAAHRLFASLRALDREAARLGLSRIAVSPIPEGGPGDAIRDRLRRAASPRPAQEPDRPRFGPGKGPVAA